LRLRTARCKQHSDTEEHGFAHGCLPGHEWKPRHEWRGSVAVAQVIRDPRSSAGQNSAMSAILVAEGASAVGGSKAATVAAHALHSISCESHRLERQPRFSSSWSPPPGCGV
jgi:hypothetical protein